MRILLISTWFPYPPANGSKLRAYYLLQALAAHHDVTALSFSPAEDGDDLRRAAAGGEHPIRPILDDPFRYAQVSEWERYITLKPPVYKQSSAMLDAVRSLDRTQPWDAVVAVQMYAASYALEVPARARVVDVDTALTYQMSERMAGEQRPGARLRAWMSMQKARQYETQMLRKFQAATVVWGAEALMLRQMVAGHGCAVEVVPNGVDCTYNQPRLDNPDSPSLVFNGSLTYGANFDAMQWFLADIYPQIKAQIPGVTLTITGSTQGVNLSQLRLDDSVRLTGFVPDIRTPVKDAAVCVTPIRRGSGTRLKILEAMALGVPIVSTSKGAEGLDIVSGEHLLLADDSDAFAAAVVTLLHSRELRSRLAAEARRLVETDYDWRMIGARFVDLVNAAVQSKPATP